MLKLLNKNFDLTGNGIGKVAKTYLLSSLLPVGNLSRGPGVKCILEMGLLHYFGRPIFSLLMRNEDRAHNFYQYLARLAGRR